MSKSVNDSGDVRTNAVTCCRRLAEFLGSNLLDSTKITCHLIIANRPGDAPTTARAVPIKIFEAPDAIKKSFLRKWLKDASMTDFDIRSIIDWSYYKTRFDTAVNKLVTIPALQQKVTNPCPRVIIPDWLVKKVKEDENPLKQKSGMDYWGRYLNKFEPKKDIEDLEVKGCKAESRLEATHKLVEAGERMVVPPGGDKLDTPEKVGNPTARRGRR